MTAEEKIKNVEAQIVLMERGEINAVACPYCGGIALQGKAMCCSTLIKCVEAIMDKQESESRAETASIIAGKMILSGLN
jgi:predicted transcriptional regulator